MVLPVTGTAVSTAYATLKDKGVNTHSYVTSLQSNISANTVNSLDVLHTLSACIDLLSFAQQIEADTTLSASFDTYVQQMVGDSTLNVHTEFTNSMTALGALVQAIVGDFPKDTSGHLLHLTFDASGNLVYAAIPATSLSNTNSAITNWLATIS